MRGWSSSTVGVALLVAAGAAACSSGEASSPAAEDASSGSNAPGSNGTSGSAGTTTTAGGGGVPAACDGDEGGAVPTTPVALQAWLGKRLYACWAHESAKHASTGPHGGDIRTYLNAKLFASMQGSGEHPEGAASVKELYGSGDEVTGWAVMVKTQAASANGQGFYWYETFGTQAGANAIEGQGKPLCVDCHAAGKDHVLIPFPLH